MDLPDRVVRVRLLLETLNDPYPTPRGALRSDSGPAASRYVPCETCRARGWIRQRASMSLCLVCEGQGWKRREAGEPEWDAYLGMPVERAVELPAMSVSSRRDDLSEEEAYGWERARRIHDKHGSYKEVRIRLDELARVAPRRHRLIRVVLIDKEPLVLGSPDEAQMNLGVVWISLRMRSVRVPPWIMERSAASERRETLAALAADGYSAGEIARRTGMSRETVRRKLRRIAIRSGNAGIPSGAM